MSSTARTAAAVMTRATGDPGAAAPPFCRPSSASWPGREARQSPSLSAGATLEKQSRVRPSRSSSVAPVSPRYSPQTQSACSPTGRSAMAAAASCFPSRSTLRDFFVGGGPGDGPAAAAFDGASPLARLALLAAPSLSLSPGKKGWMQQEVRHDVHSRLSIAEQACPGSHPRPGRARWDAHSPCRFPSPECCFVLAPVLGRSTRSFALPMSADMDAYCSNVRACCPWRRKRPNGSDRPRSAAAAGCAESHSQADGP